MDCINNNIDITGQTFEPVKLYLLEKYRDDISLQNSIIVVGYNSGNSFLEFKQQHADKKIIVYQLEQLLDYNSLWFNPNSQSTMVLNRTKHIKDWLDNADEIWDYDLDNITFLESIGYSNIKHVPLTMCDSVKYIQSTTNKKYDIVFFGALNDRRYNILKQLDEKYNLLVICNTARMRTNKYFFKNVVEMCYGQELYNHVFSAKIAINLHYYDSCIQEQVRLFELLSNGVDIISEKSKRNYLHVQEFNTTEELMSMLDVKLQELKIGISYSTFYGLEFLIDFISKFRKDVDYIVVVHQEKSFNGNLEPESNKKIINYLLDNNLIDDIHYFQNSDNIHEMITKRNIGLDYCRKNNCDYIVPLDSDETYDFKKLRKELEEAKKNNIDTLYSPINTFYYNKNFYYEDCFYVASAYKIDERVFQSTTTSVIVDPHRKMKEKKYKIIDIPMLHYNYLLDTYHYKIQDKIACDNKETQIIYDYLKEWTSDKPAKVFTIKNGKRVIDYIDLKVYPRFCEGATAKIKILGDVVTKEIKPSVSRYNVTKEELLKREAYWLKIFNQYGITPKLLSIDEKQSQITMSYCGETPTPLDFEQQSIQIQLLNILRILLENNCYYNDFTLSNFLIKNGKLFIIDFGWCPLIKKDYTCERNVHSSLVAKPYNNIYNIFDMFYSNGYLTQNKYLSLIEKHKEINSEHWVTNKNGDTFYKRWEYHATAISILHNLKPTSILEAGTMGIKLNENSDTIDLDLSEKGWRLTYNPTYNHDLTKFPWANITNKQYDCFVALRVFHHMKTNHRGYLEEMFRIANNVILALPQKVADIYKSICKPTSETISSNSDTTIIFYDKKTIDTFKTPNKITVGIVYSGRLPKLLPQIISRVSEGFVDEIIIINNSGQKLPALPTNVREIKGKNNLMNRTELSKLLANNYNQIIQSAVGDIIWLVEDDMLPEKDCFRNMLYYLLQYNKTTPCFVGSVYYSRHVPSRIVAGFFKDKPEWVYENKINNKPIEVDFTGTGCCLFRKETAPKFQDSTSFGIKSHDWAFCEDIKNSGGDVYILPDALCRHYTTETEYLIYEPQKRKEPLKRVKNGSKQSFFDIMLPRHKVHK
jgi:tRNA A-37 threonylcarbamoyl transferase component Bud32